MYNTLWPFGASRIYGRGVCEKVSINTHFSFSFESSSTCSKCKSNMRLLLRSFVNNDGNKLVSSHT